ncbi:hypothetical protein Tco_0436614 [Tanacetum coccineum]
MLKRIVPRATISDKLGKYGTIVMLGAESVGVFIVTNVYMKRVSSGDDLSSSLPKTECSSRGFDDVVLRMWKGRWLVGIDSRDQVERRQNFKDAVKE